MTSHNPQQKQRAPWIEVQINGSADCAPPAPRGKGPITCGSLMAKWTYAFRAHLGLSHALWCLPSHFLHPKLRKIDAVLIPPKPIPPKPIPPKPIPPKPIPPKPIPPKPIPPKPIPPKPIPPKPIPPKPIPPKPIPPKPITLKLITRKRHQQQRTIHAMGTSAVKQSVSQPFLTISYATAGWGFGAKSNSRW